MEQEPDLTPAQVAAILQVSVDSVYRWFADQPGVYDVGSREDVRRHKRAKRKLRIPMSAVVKFKQHRLVAK